MDIVEGLVRGVFWRRGFGVGLGIRRIIGFCGMEISC